MHRDADEVPMASLGLIPVKVLRSQPRQPELELGALCGGNVGYDHGVKGRSASVGCRRS